MPETRPTPTPAELFGTTQRTPEKFSRRARLWWIAGPVLIALVFLLEQLAPGSCLHVVSIVFLLFWIFPTMLWCAIWLWQKLTYRIGVRLFFSYALIGLLPFPILFLLLGIAGYVLLGQYTSAEYGDLMTDLGDELARVAESALDAGDREGATAALNQGPQPRRELLGAEFPTYQWFYAEGRAIVEKSPGLAELEVPGWAEEGLEISPFLFGDEAALVAIARRGERLAAAILPFDDATEEVIGDHLWFEPHFTLNEVESDGGNLRFKSHRGDPASEDQALAEASPEEGSDEPGAAPVVGDEIDDFWSKRWVAFFRPSTEVRRWSTGSTVADLSVVTRLITSPREAVRDLFLSPYQFGRYLVAAVLGISIFFLLFYLGAVLVAALQVFAIVRSTARLTRGAREVQAGALDYRIPVRRRDQLGDLAIAFNRMTDAVERMLGEVAEKERIKSELELAREIQTSLLPGRRLEHGPLSVHAFFQPSAEVGGDYFDLFPTEAGRLLVSSGDVAGHGLSTGLVMAMVKSAVSTLVSEGHRGSELMSRLNRFMREQPRSQRMVTLALVAIDGDEIEITSAGHPPVLAISDGEVREVLLSSLPVGSAWPEPPASAKLELKSPWRLVLYSDGLVEAVDGDGEPFGYERLLEVVEENVDVPSLELMNAILSAFEAHTGGEPPEDDLTVLLVGHT